jgi:hypothetical protein
MAGTLAESGLWRGVAAPPGAIVTIPLGASAVRTGCCLCPVRMLLGGGKRVKGLSAAGD